MTSAFRLITRLVCRNIVISLALIVVCITGFSATSKAENLIGDTVVLRALDKITARIQDLSIPIDAVIEFGSLKIKPRKCLKRPPEETPETSVFIEIEEQVAGQKDTLIFIGWMFASSPGLNALEHPVYDVWVIDCKISAPDSEGDSD